MNDELITKVLRHQLAGIMLHNDIMEMYAFLGMCECSCRHAKQVVEETKCHCKLKKELINKYEKIWDLADIPRIAIIKVNERPFSKLEKMKYHKMYLDDWELWEHKAKELYEECVVAEPKCNLWRKFVKGVDRELQTINHLRKRL